MKILYIEDDELLAKSVRSGLNNKYIVDTAVDGKSGWRMVKIKTYDLVILDFFLPDCNGLEFAKKIRKYDKSVAILIFTTNDDKKTIVESLNAGADDYLTKPFHFPELEARIVALTRRVKKPQKYKNITKGDIQIDPIRKLITVDNKLLNLSEQEYELLKYIFDYPHKTITRKELFEHVWGSKYNHCSNTIEVHIKRIRSKIKRLSDKNYIKSVYRLGYQAIVY